MLSIRIKVLWHSSRVCHYSTCYGLPACLGPVYDSSSGCCNSKGLLAISHARIMPA